MHIPTHILSGWCVANTPPLKSLGPRERFFCVLAAVSPDVDGIPVIWSQQLYFDYHHVVAHNLFFIVLASAVLALFSRPLGGRRFLPMFGVYFLLFHLHLLMDSFGSGPDWPTWYLWPASGAAWRNPWVWEFDDWRNYAAFAFFALWTIHIFRRHKRGPLEYAFPYADRLFVRLFNPGGK